MPGNQLKTLGKTAVLLTVIGIILTTPLQTVVERNRAMLEFRNFLTLSADLERGTDSLDAVSFNNVQNPQVMIPIVNKFKKEMARTPYLTSADWSLGRMQIAAGDLHAAKSILSRFQGRSIQNPLLYSDILMTYRELDDYEAIIDFYEHIPIPMPTESISETIASAYIRMGGSDAPVSVLRLRSNDLWATYHRWLQMQQEGNTEETRHYELALARFPIDAISPSNSTRFDAALEIIPKLFHKGIWDLHVLRSVVAYLVWKFPERQSVEALLKTLTIRYSGSEVWPLYLGELYQRNGKLEDAATLYLQAHNVNPESEMVKSRIKMLTNVACAQPDTLCERLSTIGGIESDAAPNFNADSDLEFVADALSTDSGSVRLGKNLIANGDFSAWQGDHPEGWRFETYTGSDPAGALYSTGLDNLPPNLPSIRIAALRGGRLSDNTMTLGEYIGPEFTANDSRYLVTVTYRTEGFSDGTALILLGDYRYENGEIILMEKLSPTQNSVARLRFVTPTATPGTVNLPVIRNWGNGQLWIHSIEVRPIIEDQTNIP